MACEVTNSWTFIGLVSAYIDLFIAYIFLCGSTVAYFASKILGFFGLRLPCPCNGLFGSNPNKNHCVQAMLVNNPSLKISNIQSSSMKKVPFDSISNRNSFYEEDEDDDDEDSLTNFDGEEGCCCSSSRNEKKEIFGDKNGNFGSITKGSRIGLRRPKRACSDFGLNSSSSAANAGGKFGTPASFTSVNSEDGKEALKDIVLLKQGSQDFETDDEPYVVIKKELALAKSECTGDKTALRAIEQALDEEHAGRKALYHELEKERIAASTAADEAMAMIWRLQAEKAAIEMEAKQYQRMIEEKTAFDSEEMNILKEILLRRETEKLFLEKEVEAYKQMFFEKEQFDDTDVYDMSIAQEQRHSNEEPVVMLQQITQSVVGEKCEITSIESSNQQDCINHNVLDVHVINEESKHKKDNKPTTRTSKSPKTCDNATEPVKKRNGLERSVGLPPIGPSRAKSSPSISRRNSMSAFDYERFKIDNEVGLLRERLRILQQGRENLNIPAGSLPPTPSKVMSKKRYKPGAHLVGMRSV